MSASVHEDQSVSRKLTRRDTMIRTSGKRRTAITAALLLGSSSVSAFLASKATRQCSSTSHQPSISAYGSCYASIAPQIERVKIPAAYIDEFYPGGSLVRSDSPTFTINEHANKQSSEQRIASSKSKTKPPSALPNGGRITLVGAGPGSPDLLTVAAHRIITDPSNLIIVDRLVSEEILEQIQGEFKVANKHPGCAEQAQKEIYDWCLAGLKEGRHVVRLKIGDPFVFGRGGEEVLHFRKLGVEAAVIPGVSAAFSAPLLASIPVTHRGISNQVVMCTGYGRNNTSPDLIQYHKEQTVVFLMAVGRLRALCHNLCEKARYPIETPVAIVERAGCPDQRTVVGTLENIADLADEFNVKPPSTIVVGEVVNVLMTEDDFSEELDSALLRDLGQSP